MAFRFYCILAVGLSYHGSRLKLFFPRLPRFLSLSKDGVTALQSVIIAISSARGIEH